MNSEKLIKDKLTNLARVYQTKIDAEIKVIAHLKKLDEFDTDIQAEWDRLIIMGNI
ncbi:MAG: hypothetical protein PHO29_09650 [Acetobacterium sp.]|nr:hypothetical protein [Acetobacterium sp.]